MCGRPTFDLKCFRSHHFDWCLAYQRPVVPGQLCNNTRGGRECQHITWGEFRAVVDSDLAALTDNR